MSAPEGLLLLDKPSGPTSHDLVVQARRALGQPRIGHTGTLDPPASGLLVLVLGRATRLARFIPSAPKTYEGTIRLGCVTSTDDLWGEVLRREEGDPPAPGQVLAAAQAFRGSLRQVPPAVSARKVGGKRMYALARRGHPVEAAPTAVEVSRFDLAPGEDGWTWRFTAEVSAGTYIRSLARDLGAALGCGGTLASLRRTAIGPFRVEAAQIEPGLDAVVPLSSLPLDLPPVALAAEAARRFAAGVLLPWDAPDAGEVAVRDPAGELLGIGRLAGGSLRPLVVLAPCPA